MLYFFKKFVGSLGEPLIFALLLAFLAATLLAFRRRRAARWVSVACAAFVYLCATPAVSRLLCAPLEQRFPPLGDDHLPEGVRFVVVLGSGYWPHDGVPVTAALDTEGLTRVVEGIRLHRRLANSTLVLSGGAAPGMPRPADGYHLLASGLGVEESVIVTLLEPRDTAGEAKALIARIGNQPFILVTSAVHMLRAVTLMQRAGGQPIPAPTAQRVSSDPMRLSLWLPRAGGLASTASALHEYLGLLAIEIGAA